MLITPWLRMLGRDSSLREGPLGSSTSRGAASRGQPSSKAEPDPDESEGDEPSKRDDEQSKIKQLQRRYPTLDKSLKTQVSGEKQPKTPRSTAIDKYRI